MSTVSLGAVSAQYSRCGPLSNNLFWQKSVELHADAIIRIATEEAPQDDDQRDYGDAGNYVEAIGAEESGGSNFEDDEKAEQHGDAL